MKNTLTDLNNYLFESLERLTDDSLTDEEMKKEIIRSQAVTSVAATIIQNGELALKTIKLINDAGGDRSQLPLPIMLELKK